MKKRLFFLLLALLALTGTALAAQLTEPEAGNAEAAVTIGGETAYYETFAEAWEAATNPNQNTSGADAAITLLRDAADKSAGRDFYLNHGQTVTLNLPGVTLTLNSRSFFVGGGETLILNGAPEDGGNCGKIILTAAKDDPGVVRIGSDPSAPPANLRVIRCDLESHNGPAVSGGDGNVEITGSAITARAVVSDWNRTAAVSLGPNPGVETTLKITGSTLSGQSGLSIGNGLTALVEDSAITGTGGGTFDYGVMMDGGTLTVKGESRIESPLEGVHVTGGRLDFQSGVIRAAGSSSGMMISGVTLENNTSDDTLPAPEAVICGTVESEGYGLRVAEGGTARILDGADVTGKSEGVYLTGGKLFLSGGTVTASGVGEDNSAYPYGTGLTAWGGAAEISGDAVVTGATCGASFSGDAALTVTGGTIQAGGYEYGAGLRVDGGSAALSGGTYIGAGSAIETGFGQAAVKDLLAGGFAYYRADGSIITAAEMDEMQYGLQNIRQVTVKTGDPGGPAPSLPVSSVSQTGNSTVVRTDPAALAAILPGSGELPVIFAASGGRAASGEVNAASGEISFQAKLNPQDKIFFLDPDTLIPLAKASSVAAP